MLNSIRATATMPNTSGQHTAITELDAAKEDRPTMPTYFRIRKFTIRQRNISMKRDSAPL